MALGALRGRYMDANDTAKKKMLKTLQTYDKKNVRHGQKGLYVEQKNDKESRGEFL